MDQSDTGVTRRIVTYLDLLSQDVDLEALGEALRAERAATVKASRAKDNNVVVLRPKKLRAA